MLSIGKFAKSLGVSIQTLRNWDKEGKLKKQGRDCPKSLVNIFG